jgi:putative FmdB family regulatory protein
VPLYEYRCSKCGKVFEVLQKFADAPLKRHPDCGGSVKRLVSTSSFQLKGGGWYATDYAKSGANSGKSEGSAESKSESKSDSNSDGKTDGKSESKSESKSDGKAAAKESKPAPAKT